MAKHKNKNKKKPSLSVNQENFVVSLANPYKFKDFNFDHETLGFIFKGLIFSKSKSSLEYFFYKFQSSSEYFSSITKELESSDDKFGYVKDLFFLMFRDNSYADILSFLLKQTSVMELLQYNNLGNLCLLESCIYGAINNTELLLEKKFNPNYQTPGGRNAVHQAAQSKNAHVLTKVLKHIEPGTHDLPDNQGFTPFALAVAANNIEQKKTLEKLKVNHQATLKMGNTQFTMSISDIPKKLSPSQPNLSLPQLSPAEQQLAKFAVSLLSAHDGLLMIDDIFDDQRGLATINTHLKQSIEYFNQYVLNSTTKTDPSYLEFRPTEPLHMVVSLSTFGALSATSDTVTSLAGALCAQPSLLAQFLVNNIKNFLILFNIDQIDLYNNLFNEITKSHGHSLTPEDKIKIGCAFKLSELYYDPENAVTALDNQDVLSLAQLIQSRFYICSRYCLSKAWRN